MEVTLCALWTLHPSLLQLLHKMSLHLSSSGPSKATNFTLLLLPWLLSNWPFLNPNDRIQHWAFAWCHKEKTSHFTWQASENTGIQKYCMTSPSSYIYNIHTRHKWVPCLDLGPISEISRCVYAKSFERKSKIERASALRHVWGRETSGYHKGWAVIHLPLCCSCT